jgi:cyclopropane fatty-acyl-phospholipid synthase-like methyltransferase
MERDEWFASWFDSPYYHLLYCNRDEEEAARFIGCLLQSLDLPKGSKVLDLACGKGRHSLMLSQHGLDVLGVDLSPNSIEEARKMQHTTLQFSVHDMRSVLHGKRFSAVFNLFTSFGYFDNSQENELVIQAVHKVLEPEGVFIIDFMNALKVVNGLVSEDHKQISGVEFDLHRSFDGHHIFKNIRISDGDKHLAFQERVQYLNQEDFDFLLTQNGFTVVSLYGDYNLSPFDSKFSDRLIIVAQKVG